MNNQPLFAEPSKFYSLLSKTFLIWLPLFVTVLIFSGNVFAQVPTWRYVGTLSGGAKIYLNDEIKSLAKGNKTAWQKSINSNASAEVSLSEWNCAGKIRRTLQITLYKSDGALIETRRDRFEWTRVIPGSSGETLHRRICLPAAPPMTAEITTTLAFLRALPDAGAQIVRVAESGVRFQVVPETGKDGWFNLVDEATQDDYWLTADDLKILEAPPALELPEKNRDKRIKQRKLKAKARRK